MIPIKVSGSIYSPNESATVFAQVFDALGNPANIATVTLTLFESDGTKFVDGATMSYITDSNGMYKYEFTSPSTSKRLVADVKSITPTTYGSEDFYTPQFTTDVLAAKKVYIPLGK